jgi:nitroreductase
MSSIRGDNNMNVSDAIRLKRAVRQFDDEPLPEDVVFAILNAGRRSQSAKNLQPWYFVAIRKRETLQALSKMGEWAVHLAGAAMGVAILTIDPGQRFSIMFDAGQAAAYMQLAAWELGVGSCLATIYEPDKARQLLGFPDDLHIRVAISFGYPLDRPILTAPPHKGGRRAYDEIVHWENW